MDAGAGDRAADRRRKVAVADQLDPGAGFADLGDEGLVARPLEDDDGDVVDPPAEGLGDPAEVVGRALPDVDLAGHDRPDAELLEVRIRGVDQAALLGGCEHGDRPCLAEGNEVRPLKWIDRDIDLRGVTGVGVVALADLLPDEEHRRLVALALADHDPPGELDLVHRPAHGLDGRVVGLVLLAAAHEPGRCDRGGFSHPDHLESEQLLHRAFRARRRAGRVGGAHQWRKWRLPVKTIARW